MSKLGDLLVALSEDHATLKHFALNAEAVMQHYGLSEADKDAVRNQDIGKLKAAHPKSDLLILATKNLLILAQEPPLLILANRAGGKKS
jgi:hypothetical protein